MEKRWCKRIPVSIKVVIYHNGNKLSTCKASNISLCGICLNSGPLAFHEGSMLQIKFTDANYLLGNIDTISANVVRNSHNEVGLVFNPTEPDLLNSIIKYHMNNTQPLPVMAR